MRAKRKLLISMLAIVFVLLAVVATIAIAFALTQQNITTSVNIGYTVEDVDGTVSASYTIGGVTEYLEPIADAEHVSADNRSLIFKAGDTENAGNLMFPTGQIPLTATNDNIVIQYTYSNTGAKHYIASMSFDSELVADNMKVEYSINGTDYSTNRYAVVVPANTANRSYWIKISIENKAKNASLVGDFNWLLSGCDPQEDSYLSLTSLEFQSSMGQNSNYEYVQAYKASVASSGAYVGELVFPREVNGSPVTVIMPNTSLTQEQKNQVTSVYIPDTVTEFASTPVENYYGAFENFQNLQTVTFEQNETAGASVQSGTGLTAIDGSEFKGCISLTGIEIPNTVTSVYGSAFYGCSGLTSLKVASGNTTYHAAGNCIIQTARKVLVIGCKTSIIPTDGSVTEIGYYAFDERTGLTSITIPDSVTVIRGPSFRNCVNLRTVDLGNGITGIEPTAFDNCTSLTSITIPASVEWLGVSAAPNPFTGCTNLTSVVFENPNGWTYSGYDPSTGTDISVAVDATELSNPQTAATYITSTSRYYWYRQ